MDYSKYSEDDLRTRARTRYGHEFPPGEGRGNMVEFLTIEDAIIISQLPPENQNIPLKVADALGVTIFDLYTGPQQATIAAGVTPMVPVTGLPTAPALQVPTLQVPTLQVPTLQVPTLQVPTLQVPSPGMPIPGMPTPGMPTPGMPTPGTVQVPTLQMPGQVVFPQQLPTVTPLQGIPGTIPGTVPGTIPGTVPGTIPGTVPVLALPADFPKWVPPVPQKPPMALPMKTDLATINQARTELQQIQRVNPNAVFQQYHIRPQLPQPVNPALTTLTLTMPPGIQVPVVPQIGLPVAQPVVQPVVPRIGLPVAQPVVQPLSPISPAVQPLSPVSPAVQPLSPVSPVVQPLSPVPTSPGSPGFEFFGIDIKPVTPEQLSPVIATVPQVEEPTKPAELFMDGQWVPVRVTLDNATVILSDGSRVPYSNVSQFIRELTNDSNGHNNGLSSSGYHSSPLSPVSLYSLAGYPPKKKN